MTDDFTIDFIAASASSDTGAPPNENFQILNEPAMDPDTGNNSGFGGQFSDFVLSRLYNGVFATGPGDPSQNLDVGTSTTGSNFMPNWRFVQSSNTNITAKQVRDLASPSGSNVRFTFASGAAADAAFVEQIVDIGGSRIRAFSGHIRAFALRSSGSASFTAFLETQLLDVDGNAIGDRSISTATPTTGSSLTHLIGGTTKMPPATARRLRIRAGVTRGAAATSATGAIDFAEVRVDTAMASYDIPERGATDSYTPGYLAQQNGVIYFSPDADGALAGVPVLVIAATGSSVPISGTGIILSDSAARIGSIPLHVSEIATPSTPASGFYAVYAKSDSHLYGLNDAGTEVQIDGGGSSSPPTVQIFTANGTWTKPAGCVGAIVECVGSGGGSGSTSTTGAGQASASGGGGGGGYCKTWFAASALASTESITIGNGGAKATGPGNVSGSAGGDAVFAVGKAYIMTAGGGSGGGGGTASANTVIRAGGAGGSATGGDVNIVGNDGYYGTVSNGSVFVAGYGAGAAGPYSSSTRPTSTTTTAAGNAGSSYGGGASGAATQASQTGQDGAAGAKGVVIVTEFY